MTPREQLRHDIRQALDEGSALADISRTASQLEAAAVDYAAAQVALAVTPPPGEATREPEDQALLDDPGFERRLRQVMRRSPQLLETWFRKQARIHGHHDWTRR